MKKVLLILMTFLIVVAISNKNTTEEIIIPNDSIRIRVIANSNSDEDQKIKQKIRKSIQIELSKMLQDVNDINEVRNVLKNNLKDVEYTVEKELDKNNIDMKYQVNYGNNFFPMKTYKGVKYEEGYYESIVIKLGSSKGDNWWCVLFPPLCLMEEDDNNIEEVEYKSFVKEIIDKFF